MRKLILLRGLPGSGKSTLVASLGLEAYTLSPDAFRCMLLSPIMTANGGFGVSQQVGREAWQRVFELLERRMQNGDFTVIDATHIDARTLTQYEEQVKRYRYEVVVVDFTDLPVETVLQRNTERKAFKIVPESVIHRYTEQLAQVEVPPSFRVISPDALVDELEIPARDLSEYRAIHHIGDVQGCDSVLQAHLGDHLPADEFFIFVGDYVDRGIENAQVVQRLMRWATLPNVVLLEGNHERWLWDWACGRESMSREFNNRTARQLEEAKISRKAVAEFATYWKEAFVYQHQDKTVLVTHAGLSALPKALALVSTHQLTHGAGRYEDPIHAWFEANTPENLYQVYGHRNIADLPVQNGRSFNLEGKVEFGGHLRTVTLDASGFQVTKTANPVFRPFAKRERRRGDVVPPWFEKYEPPQHGLPLLEEMRQHAGVREQVFAHVSSFSFTRKIFYSGEWDDISVRARGLFVDNENGEIVARSYDKFFNLEERPETQIDALRQTVHYPLTGYVKENGFLGIVGYDRRTDRLWISSKSTPEGDFAGWFKEILDATLTEVAQERLKRFLRDTHSSMVFEVIDPVRDPHMIAYDAPEVVLLDVLYRSQAYRKLPYEDLVRVGKSFGLRVKEHALTFPSADAFEGWLVAVSEKGFLWRGEPVEGLVFEDADGFQFKYKADFYRFWKYMRSLKDRILRSRIKGTALKLPQERGEAACFLAWAQQQSDETLALDIISLRTRYQED